jgi:cell division septal protein FtsQ
VRLAVASGLVAAACALVALSPLLRIRAVSWTGLLQLPEESYAALERQCLGRPLLLVSEASLAATLGLEPGTVRVRFVRHLPHTLEVRLAPRRAVARLEDGRLVDAAGRICDAERAVDGLPRLVGFDLAARGDRLASEAGAMLHAVRTLLDVPTLVPSEVRLEKETVQLLLADTGTRVKLDAHHLEEGLLKLRIFEQSQGVTPLPASIDLRYENQVVVRGGGGGAGGARRAP